MRENERIAIFTGHFGSGKTEMAVNYAIRLAREENKVILVDLDIVNPFFRSSEVKGILEKEGIKVFGPTFANTAIDIPSLPPDIISVFQNKECRVIFDVGGDEKGATALGTYYPYFIKEEYRMYYVINIRRPLSAVVNDITNMLRLIEEHSRLKVTDLVNNTNLSYLTEIYDIMEGQAVVEQVSKDLNIPVSYIAGIPGVLKDLPGPLKDRAFPLNIYMLPPWGKDI